MKSLSALLALASALLGSAVPAAAEQPATLRLDYYHSGTDKSEDFNLKAVDYRIEESAVSGGKKIVYGATPKTLTVKKFDDAKINTAVAPPIFYIVPPQWNDVIEVIKAHGIKFQRIEKPLEIEIESYRFEDVKWADAPFESRVTLSFKTVPIKEMRTFPANSIIIPLDQTAADAVIHLLEPDAPDSFMYWGFFNSIFEQKEYAESYILEKIAAEIQADESLREILTVLRVRTGHDFSNYKTPTLIRRIARHLQIHDLEDIPTYLKFLREHPDEIHSLLKNLLINVTNFFRDPEAFQKLQQEALPSMLRGKGKNSTLRVWIPGCSTGEEAYSIAICLAECIDQLKLTSLIKTQIFATDIDKDAVDRARQGLYLPTIAADVSPERLQRYFVKDDHGYRVSKQIREMIVFAPQNLIMDPPFTKLDLLCCRNLLIYFTGELQKKVLPLFHYTLNPGGILFLGSSETIEWAPLSHSASRSGRAPGAAGGARQPEVLA